MINILAAIFLISLLLYTIYVFYAYRYINSAFSKLPKSYKTAIAILSPLLIIAYVTNWLVATIMEKFNVVIYMEISYVPVAPSTSLESQKKDTTATTEYYEATDLQSIIDQLEKKGVKAHIISSEEDLKKVLNEDEQAYPMVELPKKKNTYH